MKKIVLFMLTAVMAISLNSCSDDDSKGNNDDNGGNKNSTISFKFDGVQKTLTQMNVTKDSPDEDGDVYLEITGSDGPMNALSFDAWQGQTGLGTMNVSFLMAGDAFYADNDFTFYITKNTGSHLEGTFSGKVYLATNSNTTRNVTEGTFSINY